MNRLLFLIFLLFSLDAFAAKQTIWDFQYSFNLKKDKIATLFINKEIKNRDNKSRYTLRFRWTLYDSSRNLYLFLDYMGHSNQYMLKQKRHMDRIEIELLPEGRDYNGRTYALLIFSEFNKERRVATINVYIKDELKRIKVDFIPPK